MPIVTSAPSSIKGTIRFRHSKISYPEPSEFFESSINVNQASSRQEAFAPTTMLTPSERAASIDRMPVFVDVLMEGLAVEKTELPQGSDSHRELHLLDLMSRKLKLPIGAGKIYRVRDMQQQRYAVQIPQGGTVYSHSSCIDSTQPHENL